MCDSFLTSFAFRLHCTPPVKNQVFDNFLILHLVIFLELSVIDVVLALVQEAPAGFLVQRLVHKIIPWTVWFIVHLGYPTNFIDIICCDHENLKWMLRFVSPETCDLTQSLTLQECVTIKGDWGSIYWEIRRSDTNVILGVEVAWNLPVGPAT